MQNMFARDMLLAEHVRAGAQLRGMMVYEVNGSRTAEEMVALIERHFEPYFRD